MIYSVFGQKYIGKTLSETLLSDIVPVNPYNLFGDSEPTQSLRFPLCSIRSASSMMIVQNDSMNALGILIDESMLAMTISSGSLSFAFDFFPESV